MKNRRTKISNNSLSSSNNNNRQIKINKTIEVVRHNNKQDLNRKRTDPLLLKVVGCLNNRVIKNLFTIMFKVLITKLRVNKFKRNNKIKPNSNPLIG